MPGVRRYLAIIILLFVISPPLQDYRLRLRHHQAAAPRHLLSQRGARVPPPAPAAGPGPAQPRGRELVTVLTMLMSVTLQENKTNLEYTLDWPGPARGQTN